MHVITVTLASTFAGAFSFAAHALPVKDVPLHRGGIWDVTFSDDGAYFATAGGDGIAKVWNTQTKSLVASLPQNNNGFHLYDVQFLSNGKRLAVSPYAASPAVWDIETAKKITDLVGHTETVSRLATSQDGTLLYTAGADDTIGVWDSQTYQRLHQFSVKSPVGLVPLKTTGTLLITSLSGVMIADVIRQETLNDITSSPYFYVAAKVNDHVSIIAGSAQDHAAPILLNTKTGELGTQLIGVSKGFGWNTAVSHDQNYLAVAYYEGPTIVWDLNQQTVVHSTIDQPWKSLSVTFSPLDHQLIVGDSEGSLHWIDLPR